MAASPITSPIWTPARDACRHPLLALVDAAAPQIAYTAGSMTTAPAQLGLHPVSGARLPLEFWGERAVDGAVLIRPAAADLRAQAPLLGHIVDGRYAVYDARVLPNSIVYFAAHLHLEDDRHVVIKRVRPDHPQLEMAARRLRHEARFLARLPKHPHLPQLYDLIRVDGAYHLVMERAPGQGLDAVLKAAGTLPDAVAVGIMQQVLDGLAVCHAAGVVHRDLKPSNIMVHRHGATLTVTLIDFGIAKDVAQAVTDLGTRLQPGTPAYMSPEQAWNGTVTPRSDLYSATAVLHRMLLGAPPARDDDTSALVLPTDTPPAWIPILETGLALFADGRFQDAAHFKAALSALGAADADDPALAVTGTGTEQSVTEQSHTGEIEPAPIATAPRRAWGWWAAAAILIALAGWRLWPVDLPGDAFEPSRAALSATPPDPRLALPIDQRADAQVADARVVDARVPDARVAAGRDATPADAGSPDAGPPDAAPSSITTRPKRAVKRPRKPAKRPPAKRPPPAAQLADRIRTRHVARCDCGPAYGAALKRLAGLPGGPALIQAHDLKSCVHLFSPDLQVCVQGRPVMREAP